jgi:hypothetical protein
MNNLLQKKNFISHAGLNLTWKMECDALTNEDWQTVVHLVNEYFKAIGGFKEAIGIPRGGLVFAQSLQQYRDPKSHRILIVDDVLTTGKSLHDERAARFKNTDYDPIEGVVLFNRSSGYVPSWIHCIFSMGQGFNKIK